VGNFHYGNLRSCRLSLKQQLQSCQQLGGKVCSSATERKEKKKKKYKK